MYVRRDKRKGVMGFESVLGRDEGYRVIDMALSGKKRTGKSFSGFHEIIYIFWAFLRGQH